MAEAEQISRYIDITALVIESLGVIVIAGGSIFVMIRAVIQAGGLRSISFKRLRYDLGKAILLGLEILVAGDIIATVSTAPTMDSVLVLGVIVLIRTFLSFSLQVELEGRWPWQKKTADK